MQLAPLLYYYVFREKDMGLWFSSESRNYELFFAAPRLSQDQAYPFFYLARTSLSPEGSYYSIPLRDSKFNATDTYCYLKPDDDTYLDIVILRELGIDI
jgi:hypothetical protein